LALLLLLLLRGTLMEGLGLLLKQLLHVLSSPSNA
jgi:hypothetical protein